MEIVQIPFMFQSKLRLAIVASLIDGSKNFSVLQKITGASAGNLGRQLEQLTQEKYIKVKKEFKNKRPNTTYSLSEFGKTQFKEYVEMLNRLLTGMEWSQE